MKFFVNVIYAFCYRYSLASGAFPKTKYSVLWTEFLMGSKSNFHNGKSIFSNSYSLLNT